VRAAYNVGDTLLWGQSMGGLAALTAIAQDIVTPAGALFTYPVCNLANIYGIGTYTAGINTAYGITGTSPNTYAEKTDGYDPVLREAADFGTVPMRFYASPGDVTVPQEDNTDQFAALVASTRVEAVVVTCTGGHGNPSHFIPAEYVAFFDRCIAPVSVISGSITGVNAAQIVFNRCVSITDVSGIQVRINSGAWQTVAAIASGSLATWTFTTTGAIAEGDTVQWQYVGGADSIVDCHSSTDVGALAAFTLTNDLDQTAPIIVSAEVGAEGENIVALVFSEDLISADFTAGWTIEVDATPLTISGATESPAGTLQITTAESVTNGQTVTISYDAGTGDIEDASGNALATFADAAVTNNVSAVSGATYAAMGAVITVGAQSVMVPGIGVVG
jgi:hypothetical protein